MEGLEIVRGEVFVVGPPAAQSRFSDHLPTQFATHTILRLTTRDGTPGVAGAASYTSHDFTLAVGEALRPLVRDVIGVNVSAREAAWERMRERTFPLPPQAHSLVDIALWDIAARAEQQPLAAFLGARRTRIPAYASTPLETDVDRFVALTDRLLATGYRAVKFHGWGDLPRDLELVRAIRSTFPDPRTRFMLDVEQRYDLDDALTMARELERLDFEWFEAPLSDFDLRGYARVREATSVAILPSGNWIVDVDLVRLALDLGAWSRLRFDVTTCGGITPALRLARLAADRGLGAEIQSWGYTLAQSANLAVMLAAGASSWFEAAVPVEPWEHAARTTIRVDASGEVGAPNGPGLGIEFDWPVLERAALFRYEVT
jgi:L-alanine-DL-glutamate epimerase-like enolase superfamily enzyme